MKITARPSGAGAIVLVSSQIGLIGHPRAAAYAASKAGLNGLAKALALELAPDGVRVNAVAPGPIATPMTAVARADEARQARMIASIPLGRFGEPQEVDPRPALAGGELHHRPCAAGRWRRHRQLTRCALARRAVQAPARPGAVPDRGADQCDRA